MSNWIYENMYMSIGIWVWENEYTSMTILYWTKDCKQYKLLFSYTYILILIYSYSYTHTHILILIYTYSYRLRNANQYLFATQCFMRKFPQSSGRKIWRGHKVTLDNILSELQNLKENFWFRFCLKGGIFYGYRACKFRNSCWGWLHFH